MVESIYFLKPAWCGNHLAGLWPEEGLQPVIKSHRLQAVVCHFFLAVLGALRVFFHSRSDTALEILALRQQLAVLKRQRPRPPWHAGDWWFWITLRCMCSRWADVLLMVKPETIVGWPRAGLRLYWRRRS